MFTNHALLPSNSSISKGFKPQHHIQHYFSNIWLWNTTKNGPKIQNFGSWTQSTLRSYTAEVRLALRNSKKSTKLVTEEARWECFFIWWRKMWALRRVFHTMTARCSSWVVWRQKTAETVLNRRNFSLRWMTKHISSAVVMKKINQNKMY